MQQQASQQTHQEQPWTVLRMLQWATPYFEQRTIPSPRTSIEWLLASVLSIRRLDLYLQYDRPLSTEELDSLRPMIRRRARHEPLQYITGEAYFMDLTLRINSDVLIPRQETEQLVELILQQTTRQANDPLHVLDLGTGSGCIPIALKKQRPHWQIFGADISNAALTVANENAQLHQTDIHFFQADLLQPSTLALRPWDLIISNPPYIPPHDMPTLEPQVRDYEPHLALFHEDPLHIADRIFELCTDHHARLFMECNDQFSDLHRERANAMGLNLSAAQDLDNRNRFLFSTGSG